MDDSAVPVPVPVSGTGTSRVPLSPGAGDAGRPPRMLVVGELLVEVMRPAAAPVPLDRTGSFLGPFASGAPAIVASVAARLGVSVSLVGAVGDDAFGRLLRRRLAADGVDTAGVRVHPELPTGCAFVAYDGSGGRDFVFHVAHSAAAAVPGDALGDVPESVDWVHVSGSSAVLSVELGCVALDAARRARAAGARVSVDPNVRPNASRDSLEIIRSLLDIADVTTPAAGELAALGVDAGTLAARGVLVCETRGAAGARLLSGVSGVSGTPGRPLGWVEVPAPPRVEVAPTGAGDHLAAALAAALLQGFEPVAAVRLAVGVAADSVTVQGPMEAEMRGLSAVPGLGPPTPLPWQ